MKRTYNPVPLGVTVGMVAIAGFVSLANSRLEAQVQQATQHNIGAAALVTNIQVQAERMRRYEKEMFIYAAVPDKRARYVGEFDAAYGKLLDHLNAARASQHHGFSDTDRSKLESWSAATTFYAGEFRKATVAADSAAPDQQAGLTLRLNNDIGPGKDQFRTLLDGAAAMREDKLQASLAIGEQVKASKRDLDLKLLGAALFVSALAFIFGGGKPGARQGGPALGQPSFGATRH